MQLSEEIIRTYKPSRETKKHMEGIRIYTGAFRTSVISSLHIVAYDLPLEILRNELGQRLLHKFKGNTIYT